jgi:ribokinase
MTNKVVVVGSLSLDLVMQVPRRPGKGETIIGSTFQTYVGGKGNNQAISAARAGASVSMVGKVGTDAWGDTILATLTKNGVDTTCMTRDTNADTGIANIYVDPDGDNSIVIVQRANALLSPDDVDNAKSLITSADVLLMQMEIQVETVMHAAKIARQAGVKVILNPAPAPKVLPSELLQNVDILVPNQPEAELLTGKTIDLADPDSAIDAAKCLQKMGSKTIIITLGEHGALVSEADEKPYIVSAYPVVPVDTTAAGDAFCGALAAALANQKSLREVVQFGSKAGALATTKPGAEPSLPYLKDIERLGCPC